MSSLDSEASQEFITLKFLRSYLKPSDTQDDDFYSIIVKFANNELRMNLSPLMDITKPIKDQMIIDKASDIALTFCISRIQEHLQSLFDESREMLKRYYIELDELLKYVKKVKFKEE